MRAIVLMLLSIFFFLTPIDVEALTKRIEVDLSSQSLKAYQDEALIYNLIVSTGKPWWPTPVGEYKPWIKLRFDRMIGGSKTQGTYYDLPNVPYVVYFYKGYALHGTYWHNNFGVPMSHGCVNLRTSDMAQLYNWLDMNTVIKISGITPSV